MRNNKVFKDSGIKAELSAERRAKLEYSKEKHKESLKLLSL